VSYKRLLPVSDLALLPIQPIDPAVLEEIVHDLQSRGVNTRLERPILRPRGSYDARRRQFRADVLLARVALSASRPVLGVTDGDCYAGNLNFVFGIADPSGGLAVVSLGRLRANATARTFMARAMKEIFHELGHAFGLRHCANSRCVMHFSNSLADTDAKNEQLCAACVQRMQAQLSPQALWVQR
jgi:archaemetzincin